MHSLVCDFSSHSLGQLLPSTEVKDMTKVTKFEPTPSKEFPGWYEIHGYPGNCANSKGEILTKSTGYKTLGGNAGRYLKVRVYRSDDKFTTMQYVHELVCTAFFGPRLKGLIVNHKDHNKKNNKKSNLEWITQAANVAYGYKFRKTIVANAMESAWVGWAMESAEGDDAQFLHDDIERIQLKSGWIKTVAYDPAEKVLEVELDGWQVYQFFDVPSALFTKLQNAVDPGRFFNTQIRNSYQSIKL